MNGIFLFKGMQRVSYDGESKRIYVHGIDYTNNIVSGVIMDYKHVTLNGFFSDQRNGDNYVLK